MHDPEVDGDDINTDEDDDEDGEEAEDEDDDEDDDEDGGEDLSTPFCDGWLIFPLYKGNWDISVRKDMMADVDNGWWQSMTDKKDQARSRSTFFDCE